MWADLINKDKVHRALWCALYMGVTLLLQNTVFAHIALFGVHAMFVPAVVVAVGVFEALRQQGFPHLLGQGKMRNW